MSGVVVVQIDNLRSTVVVTLSVNVMHTHLYYCSMSFFCIVTCCNTSILCVHVGVFVCIHVSTYVDMSGWMYL